MKKILLISVIFLASMASFAQPGVISINVDGAYTFNDRVNFDNAYADVQGAFQYGGGIEYFSDFNKSFELKYLRMDTHIPLYTSAGIRLNENYDKGSVNYILFGGNNYFGQDINAKARPYFGLGLGVGIVSIEGNSATKFAWDAKLGVKIQASPTVAVKLQGYMQSIISTFGTDVWIGAGGYAYAVPDYVTLWQFGLGAVVCFDFSK